MIFDTLKSAVDLYNHLPRYREILPVLFKYGFSDVLRLVALQHILRIEDAHIRIHPDDAILSKPLPERLRLALEELGPTFIKFGQILSSRRDLITDDYFIELTKLQSGVPPFPGHEAKEIVEKELGHPIRKLFSRFNETPVGSASIAQVHRARLSDGTEVAVKVQRPDIEKTITLDVAILHDLAKFLEKHVPEIAGLNPTGVVHEFTETLQRELDFENEASNAERFAEHNLTRPLSEISLGAVLNSLLDLLRDNHLRMKPAFYLGIKALAQVEAIGQTLDPDLNFIKLGEPYASRVLLGKFGAGRVGGILKGVALEALDFLRDFPSDFRQLYQSLRRGKLSIPLEHKIDPKGFEPLRVTLDSIANRLANAILTAAVLICSSIVLLAAVPPHVGHVSLPGILGLCFGAYMCLRLVFSIWKHGGL